MSAQPGATAPIVLTQPEIPELAAIGLQVQNLLAIAEGLVQQAQRAVIADEKTFATGTDFLTLTKTHGDELEKLRRAVKQPIDAWAQRIQDVFLPVADVFTRARTAMHQKMLAYRTEQDRIIREDQERQRRIQQEEALKRAAELEQQGNAAAANAVLEMATTPLPAVQKTDARRGSFGGKASTRDTWTAEVTNKREFLLAVLAGSTNFNLDDITVGQAALNKLASAVKVECEKNGVKIIKSTGLTLRS